MTETNLKRQVQFWIKERGGYYIKVSDKFTAGIPDLWACIDGEQWWIELKTEVGVVSAIQHWTINQINRSGGRACVCRSLSEVKKIFGSQSTGKS